MRRDKAPSFATYGTVTVGNTSCVGSTSLAPSQHSARAMFFSAISSTALHAVHPGRSLAG